MKDGHRADESSNISVLMSRRVRGRRKVTSSSHKRPSPILRETRKNWNRPSSARTKNSRPSPPSSRMNSLWLANFRSKSRSFRPASRNLRRKSRPSVKPAPRPKKQGAILRENSRNWASVWRKPVVPLQLKSSSTRNARPSSASSAEISRRRTSNTKLPCRAFARSTTMLSQKWESKLIPSISWRLGKFKNPTTIPLWQQYETEITSPYLKIKIFRQITHRLFLIGPKRAVTTSTLIWTLPARQSTKSRERRYINPRCLN